MKDFIRWVLVTFFLSCIFLLYNIESIRENASILISDGTTNNFVRTKSSWKKHTQFVDPDQAQQAYQFFNSRQKEYEDRQLSRRFKMRGIGYMYYYHNLLLIATLPSEPVSMGFNRVIIRNVFDRTDANARTVLGELDCQLFTLYVRVNGPEIFAGSAIAVSNDDENVECHWEFPFHLHIPGKYIVDAKLLYYNGSSYMESSCIENKGDVTDIIKKRKNQPLASILANDTTHRGFKGFKMYTPAEMCCEICSRISSDCAYWATPPIHIEDSFFGNNGCELYMNDTSSEWMPISMFINESSANDRHNRHLEVEHFHGPPNGHRPVYFLGCGWSFWMTLEYPCLNADLDDRIYIMNHQSSFTLLDTESTTTLVDQPASSFFTQFHSLSVGIPEKTSTLPLCTLETELPDRHFGRWVRDDWPDATVCPQEMQVDTEHSGQFEIMEYDPDHPVCWHRDDLSIVGQRCIEMNCQFITEESKWKTSSLHQEKKFYGTYQQYHCRYQQYTDPELQQCIQERKITKIDGSGDSIWYFLVQYVQQRIQNLTLYDNGSEGLEIHLSSLSLLHHSVRTLNESLHDLPMVNPKQLESYWINSLYISSEREHEARGPIQLVKSGIAHEILGTKHYRMLNLYDMTAAFTFDTATQMDGMHIIGPPMKMLITKLFHYMCLNTTVSQRYPIHYR
jgi:hypothetical protein